TPQDTFLPHRLTAAELAPLLAVLADPAHRVGRAWLVRKQLRYLADEKPYFILVLRADKGPGLKSDEEIEAWITRLVPLVDLPGPALLIPVVDSLLWVGKKAMKAHCAANGELLFQPVLAYEIEQKGASEADIWPGLQRAYDVMRDAVHTGLTGDMTSRSGMINNGAKKIAASPVTVLSPEFKNLVVSALGAKEVNSCMGRVVAAPTAGASGILPGVLTTIQNIHRLPDQKILEGLLVAAGIALIIEQNASLAGAVGGCQAETGSAAAMGAGAIVYCLGGPVEQVFAAVAITIQ
nr:hypothetical protein [Tanacetum cinerariifolium]